MNQSEKEAIIDKLINTKRKGHSLEIDLCFKGMDDDAKTIKDKSSELSRKIDDLLANIMRGWVDNTTAGAEEELKKVNRKIQDTIRKIKKEIEIAKNIVKATGYLDEAIKIAFDLLA